LDVPAKVAEFRSQITISTLDTIQDVVMALSPIFSRETDVRLDIEDATVQIGPQNLYKLCSELIDNALKFSNKGDAVTVKGSAEAGTYKIEVVDSGRGMTTEQIESIGAYQQFGRREFEQQGAGLGLAIAKLLVLLHGGEFTVSSETGNGTVVKITLPIAQEIDF
jgi:signal transduction histidine kinase